MGLLPSLVSDSFGYPKLSKSLKLNQIGGPAAKYFITQPEEDPLTDFKRLGVPIVLNWLRDCFDSHFLCPRKSFPRLPTRILDVQPGSDAARIRLHLSKGEEQEDYFILSYRWGGPQRCMLNTLSLEDFKNGIVIADLPKTIADTIEVTRALRCRYLWVDALCILQDSEADLSNELARMKDYYRRAFLAIQPSGLLSANEAFLKRKGNSLTSGSIQLQNPSIQNCHSVEIPCVTVDGEIDTVVIDTAPDVYDPTKEPIHERAWVLQERLLCPRVLIFPLKAGFILQCDQTEKLHGKIFYNTHSERDAGNYRLPQKNAPHLMDTDRHMVLRSWWDIERDYALRDLSEPNDKLVAIAALAEHFSDTYGTGLGTYCAGQWRNFMADELQWTVAPHHIQPAPKQQRAPSWSWASVDGGACHDIVTFLHPPSAVQVEDCTVVLKFPHNPFGPVESGLLKVKAHLLEVFWGPSNLKDTPPYGIFSSQNGGEYLGAALPDALENRPRSLVPIYLVPLAVAEGEKIWTAMLVRHIDGDVYRRVGGSKSWKNNDHGYDTLNHHPAQVFTLE